MSSAGKTGKRALFSAMPLALSLHHLAYKINDNGGGLHRRRAFAVDVEMTERSDSSVAAVGRYTP